jgi:glutathione S-transferase
MSDQPTLVLHSILFSHPCLAVRVALDRKGLEYETVNLVSGSHAEEIEAVYGEGRRTVPGLVVDGEPVHGSVAVMRRIDELVPEGSLYPEGQVDAIGEAERWGSEDLQATARNLIWGALHFRPEALGTFGGAGPLDPAGVDFAIKLLRGAWRYTDLSAERIAADLAELPGQLDHVDALVAEGVVGGDEPTGADLQIGSSLHLLMKVGDLRPLIRDRPAEALLSWFPEEPGDIPIGAFPAGWVPKRAVAA